MVFLKIFATLLALFAYIGVNLYTAGSLTAREMRRRFIDGQCFVGMVFANAFYAPAWFLKGLRFLAVRTIK